MILLMGRFSVRIEKAGFIKTDKPGSNKWSSTRWNLPTAFYNDTLYLSQCFCHKQTEDRQQNCRRQSIAKRVNCVMIHFVSPIAQAENRLPAKKRFCFPKPNSNFQVQLLQFADHTSFLRFSQFPACISPDSCRDGSCGYSSWHRWNPPRRSRGNQKELLNQPYRQDSLFHPTVHDGDVQFPQFQRSSRSYSEYRNR